MASLREEDAYARGIYSFDVSSLAYEHDCGGRVWQQVLRHSVYSLHGGWVASRRRFGNARSSTTSNTRSFKSLWVPLSFLAGRAELDDVEPRGGAEWSPAAAVACATPH